MKTRCYNLNLLNGTKIAEVKFLQNIQLIPILKKQKLTKYFWISWFRCFRWPPLLHDWTSPNLVNPLKFSVITFQNEIESVVVCFCVRGRMREREWRCVCVSEREKESRGGRPCKSFNFGSLIRRRKKTSAAIGRAQGKGVGGGRLSPATTTTTTSANCSKRCEHQVRERERACVCFCGEKSARVCSRADNGWKRERELSVKWETKRNNGKNLSLISMSSTKGSQKWNRFFPKQILNEKRTVNSKQNFFRKCDW